MERNGEVEKASIHLRSSYSRWTTSNHLRSNPTVVLQGFYFILVIAYALAPGPRPYDILVWKERFGRVSYIGANNMEEPESPNSDQFIGLIQWTQEPKAYHVVRAKNEQGRKVAVER